MPMKLDRTVVLGIATLVQAACSTADRPVEARNERLAQASAPLVSPLPVLRGSRDFRDTDAPVVSPNTQTANVRIPAGFHRR
jgi:hypothetical protein